MNARQLPKLSTIIPVKNGARFLAGAIESVLDQHYPHLELIVVDGGSTDGSVEIARGYPGLRVVTQSGSGLGDAWNTGIETARGELLSFLDSDDFWAPDTLVARVEHLLAAPEARYGIAKTRFFLTEGAAVPKGFKPALLDAERVTPIPGTLLAHRDVFERVGGFSTQLRIAADVDWFARVKDAGMGAAVFDRLVLHKRVHEQNLSSGAEVNTRELLQALRASVKRQRSGTSAS